MTPSRVSRSFQGVQSHEKSNSGLISAWVGAVDWRDRFVVAKGAYHCKFIIHSMYILLKRAWKRQNRCKGHIAESIIVKQVCSFARYAPSSLQSSFEARYRK